jgi:glycosyltransferase involved in cell wall biosynthesis
MSVGTPVIISNVGYINDVLGDNYPLYCIPRSVSSIVHAINTFINYQDKFKFNEFIIENYKQYSRDNHRINLLNIFSFEN